ncbi:YebG family protein [Atlantibacter hermannii]|uniref:YebG family protein n=1 Tax=Atlantibacter hermannii TaxID=565 RepID=UPI0020736860|nr:YebG family protein [Atlantibacter hermannii]MDU7389183.1 YebG family protein [Atlantibacter hermannii]
MAVEIHYVVVREGKEKMSFANKKEADAYDKMLDLAQTLESWLQTSPVTLEETQLEPLSLWLAEHKDTLAQVLRTGQMPQEGAKPQPEANVEPLASGRKSKAA